MDFCLWQGIPQGHDKTSCVLGRLFTTTSVCMPLVYVISPNGWTGAELRVARDTHELKATGQCARLGALLPYLTNTTTVGPNGAPVEVSRRASCLVLALSAGFLAARALVASGAALPSAFAFETS